MNPQALRKKVRALMDANQINEYTALRYAERLEGTCETDHAGKAIVRDELGREVARVILPKNTETTSDEPRTRESRCLRIDAEIVTHDGRMLPVLFHQGSLTGRIYGIETKPSLLDIGIAAMQPLNGDFTVDDAASVEFHASLPADPEAGRLTPGNLDHFTDHRNVVALARRFYVLATLDEAAEGPLTITASDLEP